MPYLNGWLLKNKRVSGPAYTAQEEFENKDFTLKRNMFFRLHAIRRRKLKTEQLWAVFDLYLMKVGQGNHTIILFVSTSFSRSCVFKMLSVHTKTKAFVFKFLCFDELFPKAPFS